MHNLSSDRDKPMRAQSVVEFALLLPLLIVLLAGAVDLGNAFQTWINLTNAAREGARYQSAVNDASGTCTRVQNMLTNDGISVACSDVTISYPSTTTFQSCTTGTYKSGCPVRVSARYGLSTLVGNVLNFNPIMITGSVDMVIY